MGVTGLWTVVQPCARPVKIETLNKKRLAVDASIWIYQFLKAVRDKEGNALRNSHVVGFFRRICKLLFFGIKPVFVFDGGAPALKRQTISGRKQRREGRREDAVRTAGKLLALQMQRRAEEEEQRAKEAREAASRPQLRQEEEVPDNPIYVDELAMTEQERQQNKRFKKKDQYHLPDLDVSMAEMGQPNDPRVMSVEELEAYARQFDTGEDINVYDFSKIDFNSPFFQSLPPTDRYNILNAARLRSRLRMGYSKDQLEDMFPDRMAFSRFQIDRVKERNELTQRLMHVTGMNENMVGVEGQGRIAGEKGREYVLVRSAGAEGGWALGVIGGDKDEGQRAKPIDVDEVSRQAVEVDEEESEDEIGFEDVPIEGLNRLPKAARTQAPPTNKISTADIMRRRAGHGRSRNAGSRPARPTARRAVPAAINAEEDEDALFVGSEPVQADDEEDDAVAPDGEDDQTELQKAIAMSLEKGEEAEEVADDEEWEDALQESKQRSDRANVITSEGAGGFVPSGPFQVDEDEDLELEDTLENARQDAAADKPDNMAKAILSSGDQVPASKASAAATKHFAGPLPFETLDLGSSLLGKKKMKQVQEDQAGGFEKKTENEGTKNAAPVPPWFQGDLKEDMDAQKAIEDEDQARARREREEEQFDFGQARPRLQTQDTKEVIDIDAMEDKDEQEDVISIASSHDSVELGGRRKSADLALDTETRMGDLADLARAEPPTQGDDSATVQEQDQAPKGNVPSSLQAATQEGEQRGRSKQYERRTQLEQAKHPTTTEESDDEALEWEESDHEDQQTQAKANQEMDKPAGGTLQTHRTRSASMDFEDVTASGPPVQEQPQAAAPAVEEDNDESYLLPKSGTADQDAQPAADSDDEGFLTDDEDEELLMQMTTEAEEHARFASQLNNKSTRQNIEEYERELKALRNQQKKDRRDADEVTHVMVTECQQLLKLFGLPYITAPMEAEAQCAELVHLGLVDGIVTDDSDIFLFGGTRIYKNMFNQAKFVECYLTSDLEREYDLTREKMIRIAHLLGSDYTEGLPGIGPVTALEIISEFQGGLAEFKTWWSRVQTGATASAEDLSSPFRKKFRRNSTKLFLPPVFPDLRVDQAYLKPELDSDPSVFQWGVPDLDSLRSFLMATIGWSQERTDEVLVPVVRDMNRRENEGTQANITNFLGGGGGGAGAFAPRRRDVGKSKRMEGALEKLAAKARERRLNGNGEASTTKNGAQADVNADVVVIAQPGSAVDEAKANGKDSSKGRSKPAAKRKAVRTLDDDEEEEEEGNQPPAKQKRPRKGAKPRSRKKAAA